MTLDAFDDVYFWVVGVSAWAVVLMTIYSRWAIVSGRGHDLYRHSWGRAAFVVVAVVLTAASGMRLVLAWREPGNIMAAVVAALTAVVGVVVIVLAIRLPSGNGDASAPGSPDPPPTTDAPGSPGSSPS